MSNMANTIKALRDLRAAYFKLDCLWNSDNEALNSETSLRFYPFSKSFNELGIDCWVEAILDTYMDLELMLSLDKGRIYEDDNLKLEDRTFVALREFREAWFNVYNQWEDNDVLDSQVSLNNYPFDKSWGDIYVYDWVDYIIENEL